MGYYIRVLGSQDPDIHIDELIDALRAEGWQSKSYLRFSNAQCCFCRRQF
jgi:hypothetical protein